MSFRSVDKPPISFGSPPFGINSGWGFQKSAAAQYLLAQFPGASIAYSFRKLSPTYSGPCCRIRRSTDNEELDVLFLNDVVDVSSAEAFVGVGNDGYLVKQYDQSGNSNDRVQCFGLIPGK